MKQDTPYRDRPATERARELACMNEVLFDVVRAPERIYETFGGIGMVTAFLRHRFQFSEIVSTELDFECVQQAKLAAAGADIHHADCFKFLDNPDFEFEAAVLDFNQCTIRDLTWPKLNFQQQVMYSVVRRKPQWIELTDSACGKLHLNFKTYGLENRYFGGYERKLSQALTERFGYRIVKSSKHHAAAYFRLEPA